MGNPSQSYGTSLAIWDHTVFVTCHPTQVNAPRLTPAIQAGTRFTYPGGMEGWVDLVDLLVPQPGVKPVTFRSRVRRQIAAPPRHPFFFWERGARNKFGRGQIIQERERRRCHPWLSIWPSPLIFSANLSWLFSRSGLAQHLSKLFTSLAGSAGQLQHK